MRWLKGVTAGFAAIFIILALFELFIPSARGILPGVGSMLWTIFTEFFAQDFVLTIVLFIVFALSLFGTVYLSKRSEKKVLFVVGIIVSIVSLIGMLAAATARK